MQLPDILIKGLRSGYEVEHLTRVFFPGAKVRQTKNTKGPIIYARAGRQLVVAVRDVQGCCHIVKAPPCAGQPLEFELSRMLYSLLRKTTGLRPPWGLLTGVRPISLLRKKQNQGGSSLAKQFLLDTCNVLPEKYDMLCKIDALQQPALTASTPKSYSLYISIPFCPTRCAYCSFVSHTVERDGYLIKPYLNALKAELKAIADTAMSCGLQLQTIYIGGGTPTVLEASQLEQLLQMVELYFDTSSVAEYTVEAGRPDCTNYEKLTLLKEYNVGRISINPQSMNDTVLQQAGRNHTASNVIQCYEQARRAGIARINMDLIAGLQADSAESFAASLKTIASLKPDNITVHTLTLKRASALAAQQTSQLSAPGEMLQLAYPFLYKSGYVPYYLYRQKSGIENLENTGWCLPDAEGLYNIYIMEEAHTILAAGAGASTKLVDGTSRIKRLYNHKLPLEYINNINTVLQRKRGVEEFYACNMDT